MIFHEPPTLILIDVDLHCNFCNIKYYEALFFIPKILKAFEDYTISQFSVNHVFRVVVPEKVTNVFGNRRLHLPSFTL